MGQDTRTYFFFRCKSFASLWPMLPSGNSQLVWTRTRISSRIRDRAGTRAVACQRICRALAVSVTIVCAALTTDAQAADYLFRQAAPIEYARICDASGAAFFFIPGSDSCQRAGSLLPGKMREPDLFYGIVGPPFHFNSIVDVATRASGGPGQHRNTFSPGAGTTAQGQTAIVNKSFIQFAGLTSGRTQFMFDSYADTNNHENLRRPGAIVGLFAYTATFGAGFSSIVCLDDSLPPAETGGSRIVTSVEVPFGVDGVIGTSPRGKPVETRISEIVGNLRLDQPWDAVRLLGTTQAKQRSPFQANALATIAPFPSPPGLTPPYAFPALTSSPHGLAVQEGGQANLDYLSPGDKLWLQAAYEKGAAGYVADNGFASTNNSASQSLAPGSKFAPDVAYSAVKYPQINFNCVFARSRVCEQQWSWDITGAYKNYWLPILNSTPFGSTLEIRKQADAPCGVGSTGGSSNPNGARIEPGLFRSPLRGFDIGAEYMYAHLSKTRPAEPALDSGVAIGGLPAFGPNTEVYEGRLRVQHGF
jgi:Porin subfamily